MSANRRPPAMWVLPAAIVALLAGLWGGLARLGYSLPSSSTSSADHGVLMSLGFLGTLIAVERATALGRPWGWFTPTASVVGALWMVAGLPAPVGQSLLLLAGIALVAVYIALDRVQRSTHNTLMLVAALGWASGVALWLGGRAIFDIVPWLAVFLVVTITAERLELSRFLGTTTWPRRSLVVATALMVVGAAISIPDADLGSRVAGAAMIALAAWLGHFDLARRTVLRHGVTRFMAVGLLAGYAWLATGGVVWLVTGDDVGAAYDVRLHAVFLGFVMSMVFAHAPVIAPAVVRRPLPYTPAFYGPLLLLHAGLLLRIAGGDALGVPQAFRIGGDLNEVALLGFVIVTAGSMVRAARRRRSPKPAVDRGPLRRPIAVGAGLGVVLLAVAVVFANSGGQRDTGSASVDAAAATSGVAVSLVDMRIVPSNITVTPGSHLILRVTNNGSMEHDLRLSSGVQTPLLRPGQTSVLDAGVVDSKLDGWCTVPGHRAAGMTMTINVDPDASAIVTAGTSGAPSAPGMGAMPGMGGATASGGTTSAADASSSDLSARPPAGWAPIDATLPPVPAGTTHKVTWHIKDVTENVAPGVTQTMWTFNGTTPGPVLHGHVGDSFDVTLVNDTTMSHNIDFHAESGPPSGVMAPVPPGGTRTYHFVATRAGAWLYHCSVEPMLLHMGNGMYGALIIDPPNLRPAAKQYVLVGSEFFFGPEGSSGDYAKMLADTPDAVVFNGYPFGYQHAPLTASAGDLVRVWVVDAGPNESLAFHVVGAPFSATYLDGAYLLDPRDTDAGGAQTLPVDPGDGGFVELTFSQPGSYPFLTHDMADAVRGASGVFAVGP